MNVALELRNRIIGMFLVRMIAALTYVALFAGGETAQGGERRDQSSGHSRSRLLLDVRSIIDRAAQSLRVQDHASLENL